MTAWPRILRAAHERSISFVRIMPQSQATPRGKKRMTFTTASCRTNAFRKSTTSTSKRAMCRFTATATANRHRHRPAPPDDPLRRVSLLYQNHGKVRIRIMRRIGGTFRNPALEGRRWCRWKCRCGVRLAGGIDGSYGVGQAELLHMCGRYGCILRT